LHAGAAAAADPLSVSGTFSPAAIHFGDPLIAEVNVQYDAARVDPGSIHVVPGFGPFVQTASPAISRTEVGGVSVLRLRYPLQCVTAGCLPTTASRELTLPRIAVSASADG